jgi:hypothetical protein
MSMLASDAFDAALLLGPMYHIVARKWALENADKA